MYLDKKEGKLLGQVHLRIAKVSSDSKDPLVLQVNNGTNEILLKAFTIKEKVEWTNAIVRCQNDCLDSRYSLKGDKHSKKNTP